MANTTVAFRARRRGIDTVPHCAAKTSTPPSTERHHFLSNDLKVLVWGVDADTPLRQALQNDRAIRASVAERHIAVRAASWPLTLSEFQTAAPKP